MLEATPPKGPLATKAKEYMAAAYEGRLMVAASSLAPDVQLIMGGRGPLSGVHQGKDAFFRAFAFMMSITGGSYRLEAELDWMESDNRACLLALESAVVGTERVTFHRVIIYEFVDGLISQVQVFEGDPEAANRAFGG